MNEKFNLPINVLEKKFKRAMVYIPGAVGNEVVNFALDNFKRQSFAGAPWPNRKQATTWGKKQRTGALLVKSGRLRRSIEIKSLSNSWVKVGSDVPYATIHNNGFRGNVQQTVRSFTRQNGQDVKQHTRTIKQNIPARPFLKESPYLQKKIERQITVQLLKSLKL